MLQVFIENEVVNNPTCKVRWCVDNETINYFRDRKIAEPKILLIVVNQPDYETPREYRYIFPLTDLSRFIQVTRSGDHKIYATIVWDKVNGKSAETRFLSKDDYEYRTDVLSYDKKTFYKQSEFMYDYAELLVKVDKALFPKKPADWDWVNLWFNTVSRDQCHHRKRRFIAYSIQPIAMAILVSTTVLYETVFGLLTVIGMACIGFLPGNWKYLRPLSDFWSLKYAFSDKKEFFTKWYTMPLRPVFLLSVISFAVVWGIVSNATYFWQVVGYGISIFTVMFIVYVVLGKYAVKPVEKLTNAIDKMFDTFINFMKLKAQERAYKKMVRTSCLFIDKENPLNIPKEAKTTKLMFDGIKRNVCRPFEE